MPFDAGGLVMQSQRAESGPKEGTVVAGKYVVERVIGVGGMGVVVAARHLELDERVALKFLLPETLQFPDVVARFSREARAAVRIKSEHVARIIDVGRLEDGAPYIVMEYLEGGDLEGLLEKRGALSVERAVDFTLQALEAVAAAHALGIVHRDLKPANLFLTKLGDGTTSIKVLDFGISKRLSGESIALTQRETMLGSPLYMPPEQMRAPGEVDTRSDIWSVGVILYELLSGKSPFLAPSIGEVLIQVLEAEPPRLSTVVPRLPQGLEQVVHKCLAKAKENRYATVGELAMALRPFAPPKSWASIDRVVGSLRTPTLASADSSDLPSSSDPIPAAGTRGAWSGTQSGALRTRWHLYALAFVLTLLGGGLVAWWKTAGTGAVPPAASGTAQLEPRATQPSSGAEAPRPREPEVAPVVATLSTPSASATSVGSVRPRQGASGGARRSSPAVSSPPPAPVSSAAPVAKPPSNKSHDAFEDR